jgi:DNA polymerase (family 10)
MARARRVSNQQVVRALRELALFLEMDEVAYKPRAYEKAADAVAALDSPLAEVYAEQGLKGILEVPAVGKGIGGKIEELLRHGRIEELEELRARTPLDVLGLTAIEGLGPKHAKALHDALGIRSLEQLEAALRAGRVREIPHFGEKSEQKLLRGLEVLRRASGRHLLGHALPLAREIEARLRQLPGVGRAAVAGSIRRCKETIGDLDFLAVSEDPRSVMEFFVAMPEVEHVYAQGRTKTLVRLASGIDADLRVVPEPSFGAALHYFTGSKDHNVALRRIAQEQGLKLNEYGVFRGKRAIAGSTEQEVYAALGLPYIEPELREDRGEIEAAQAGRLPKLIEHGALRGDLQIQTDWTDGDDSIEAMAQAARELGLEYIAITDHTRDLKVTRGSDEEKLREQGKAIHALNRKLRGIRVLTGAEVNIRRDGSLDISDDALAELDVVGVAIHSYFDQPRDEMTRRVIRAIENPHVDVLFHPTARTLGHREPVALDIDAVIAEARRTGTLLEIDALPERLDLRDEHVRKAVEAGVKLVIDSDAHHREHLRCADEFGIATARRGWATRKDIANAWPLEKFLRSKKDGC